MSSNSWFLALVGSKTENTCFNHNIETSVPPTQGVIAHFHYIGRIKNVLFNSYGFSYYFREAFMFTSKCLTNCISVKENELTTFMSKKIFISSFFVIINTVTFPAGP